MQTEHVNEQVNQILEEVDRPSVAIHEEPDEPMTEGEFPELIEGEVIENPPKPAGISIRWLFPVGVVSLVLALVGVLVIVPLFAQSATIMITPDTQTVTAKGQITLAATLLLSKSVTLSEQVKTTGTAHQNATQAHGWVTFYNALQSPQDIPAGTLLVGTDSIHIITDAEAYIPAGALATNGSVTVPAHTAIVGIAGNIQAGDMNGPCCREYVFAYSHAFSGGKDARDYKTATSSDIHAASTDMASLIQTQMLMDAQKNVTAQETLLTPLCHTTAGSSPTIGTEATQITVSLTSSCTLYRYSKQALTVQEHILFTQVVSDQLGTGYVVHGSPEETRTTETVTKGMLTVSVKLSGRCTYHFRSDEIRNMQQLVTGKSRDQATMLLLHVRGIHTVGIQIDNGKTTIPDKVKNIAVTVYERE